MGCGPYRLTGSRRGATSLAQVCRKFFVAGLLTTVALTASLVSTHAQVHDWTGQTSSNWFVGGNWDATFPPRRTDDVSINTVTPNATVIGQPGAVANTLDIGPNGTGMLTIQTGGTLVNELALIGNLPGGLGTVMVTGAGSSWTNVGTVVVGGQGTGTLTVQDGGTMRSAGGSVGLSAGSTGTVTVTGDRKSVV